MTERLYYNDGYLKQFRAQVIEIAGDGHRVYLDRTAFYPSSGGQPADTGTLNGIAVIDVADEGERVVHVLETPVGLGPVDCKIDWASRYDHMQQHTGQHLLSAVLEELFQFKTVSVHMGAEVSTIELATPAVSAEQMQKAEQRCGEIVGQGIPVSITYEDAAEDLGLRKASERTGTLRIISIGTVDRSACGGTHLRTTAEIGAVLIRKSEKLRGNTRIEFVCGARALRHARADFSALAEISRQLAVPLEESAGKVATLIENQKTLEKQTQKLSAELARREGIEQWTATAPDADGIRRVSHSGILDDATRARAQAFVSRGNAIFLAINNDPLSVMLAASTDSGIHAGERVKALLASLGGRGGGAATMAQASLPANADLAEIARVLLGNG